VLDKGLFICYNLFNRARGDPTVWGAARRCGCAKHTHRSEHIQYSRLTLRTVFAIAKMMPAGGVSSAKHKQTTDLFNSYNSHPKNNLKIVLDKLFQLCYTSYTEQQTRTTSIAPLGGPCFSVESLTSQGLSGGKALLTASPTALFALLARCRRLAPGRLGPTPSLRGDPFRG
jgi:hypothetical protein